ncbi:DnaJ-like protein 6, partial [Operophtera brumata]
AIGNAAAILTDPEKRKQYDIRGAEPAPATHHHHQYYARGFESDLTAEELFNMFFGAAAFPGGGGPGGVYARRRRAEPEARGGEAHGGLVQLLPVAVLVLLSMMSGFFINEPVFSLSPTAKYTVPRETVPYYVKDNFHSDYQGSLRRLEMAIEEDMAWKARNFGDSKQYAEAQKLRTPSCEKLNNLQR